MHETNKNADTAKKVVKKTTKTPTKSGPKVKSAPKAAAKTPTAAKAKAVKEKKDVKTPPIPEEVKAETPVEEPKKEEPKIEDAAPIVVTESATSQAPNCVVNPVPLFTQKIDNFDAHVEENRVPFYKQFFKIKLISYILIGFCLAIVVALFILVFTLKDSEFNWIIYVLLGVVVAVLIGNMIFSKLTTKKNELKFKTYVFGFLRDLQEACYQDIDLKDAVVDVEGKIENEDVYNAHVYSTINRIESRSVVKGKLNNRDFVSADIALTTPPVAVDGQKSGKSKANEVFAVYGRVFKYDFALADEKAIMIVRKASSTVMPDHTIGYKEVQIPGLDEDFVVLTTDENIAFGFFTAALIEKLNALKPNDNLFDYIISVNDKGTYIYTNYNDNYMVVPTNKAHPVDCYKNVIEDNRKIIAVLDLLK